MIYIAKNYTLFEVLLALQSIDDYNKNLIEFEAAGAHAIKFRNDVNHRGKGAYGGESGPLWNGNMISYDSSPFCIAHDLTSIMRFGMEVRRVTEWESLTERIQKANTVAKDKNNVSNNLSNGLFKNKSLGK